MCSFCSCSRSETTPKTLKTTRKSWYFCKWRGCPLRSGTSEGGSWQNSCRKHVMHGVRCGAEGVLCVSPSGVGIAGGVGTPHGNQPPQKSRKHKQNQAFLRARRPLVALRYANFLPVSICFQVPMCAFPTLAAVPRTHCEFFQVV